MQTPIPHIETHAKHDAGIVAINTTTLTEIVIANITQNMKDSDGIAIAINKHIMQLINNVIPTAATLVNINDMTMHIRQKHSPSNITAHAPNIGSEHIANIGHITVDTHIDKTQGVYINSATVTMNSTAHDTTNRNTVSNPTVHIIKHIAIELIMVTARTALIHIKQLHSPTNATSHTPAKEKNMATNSGQTHMAKVMVSKHGVYTNDARPTPITATKEIIDETSVQIPSKDIAPNDIKATVAIIANVVIHTIAIHDNKQQNVTHAIGTPHAIIKHATNDKNARNAASNRTAIVNNIEEHMKQHSPIRATAHIPIIGIENAANSGHTIVAKHNNITNGVNINSPIPTQHVSKYESIVSIVIIAATTKATHMATDRMISTMATIMHTDKIRRCVMVAINGISTIKNSHMHGMMAKKRQNAISKNIS